MLRNFILPLIFSTVTASLTKIWSVDYNFHEKNRWIWDKVKCSKDSVVIPNNYLVFLPLPINGLQVVLPYNGLIVLGNNTGIGVKSTRRSKRKCRGKQRMFFIESKEWLDPRSWNTTLYGRTISGKSHKNPIPHIHRVPCVNDEVVFPINETFKTIISLPEKLEIGSIVIGGQKLHESEFKKFLESKVGRFMFEKGVNKLSISGKIDDGCESKCPCQSFNFDYERKVCSFLKCPEPECNNPIKPEGFCCPICSIMIKVAPKEGLLFSDFHGIFEQYWVENPQEEALGYAYSSEDGHFVGIITDLNNRLRSLDVSKAILQEITRDPNFDDATIELITSAVEQHLALTFYIWCILFLIVLVGIGYASNYAWKNDLRITWPVNRDHFGRSSQFTFIRFHGSDESEKASVADIELESTGRELMESASSTKNLVMT